jgi:hypothetical protein
MPVTQRELTRRRFLAYFSSVGLSSTLLPGVLWAKIQDEEEPRITKDMLGDAEQVAGLEFTDEERDLMLEGLNSNLDDYERLRMVELSNEVPPALYFDPIPPGVTVDVAVRPARRMPRFGR